MYCQQHNVIKYIKLRSKLHDFLKRLHAQSKQRFLWRESNTTVVFRYGRCHLVRCTLCLQGRPYLVKPMFSHRAKTLA